MNQINQTLLLGSLLVAVHLAACSPDAQKPSAQGYVSHFNIRTDSIPQALNGSWLYAKDDEYQITFEPKGGVYSVGYTSPAEDIAFDNATISCNVMSVCEVIINEESQVLFTFELVDQWFFYLIQFPEQPVLVEDYRNDAMKKQKTRLPFSVLFQKPGAPQGKLM